MNSTCRQTLWPAAIAALGIVSLSFSFARALAALSEPLGPSSRRSGLVISEIMFHPLPRPDGRNLEFIELYNSEAIPADLSGFRLSGDVDFTFPSNTTLAGLSFLVIAPVPADIEAVSGIKGVLGSFGNRTNSLPNDSGTIRLRNRSNAVLLEVHYRDESPWPAAADGAGHSLVLARPSRGEGDPHAWGPSLLAGGSPGAAEPANTDPMSNVVINEFLAHTDDPEVDYIELYNHGNQTLDLSGCILTDDPLTNKFFIPPNTFIEPRGFVYFTQTNMQFALNAAGETIYFKNAAQTRVLDAVRFGGQQNGVATGRVPDGSDEFDRLRDKTPGAANGAIRVSDVVINELMYHPISEQPDDQFVELYNRSAGPVNLGGWKLGDAIDFTFPSNTAIAADGYLVVAKNASRLMTNCPGLSAANTLGDFSGKLSGSGDRLVLSMPDTIVVTNSRGLLETNLIDITVDDVTYGTGGRWGKWSDGGGSSLELIDSRGNHRLAANWADSNDEAKSQWTDVEYTGVLSLGSGNANSLELLLQGAGECLVDQVEVIGPAGTNLVANPLFETGTAGWSFQGNHVQSGWESAEGFNSGGSLHVRASDHGDTGANRIRTTLTAALSGGQTATLRAKARWLKGNPEILLRLHGNWLEATGRLSTPPNAGTPGGRNSRASSNTGPAIYEVAHSPLLPAANEPVIVTARVHDPDGLSSVWLNYRLDPTNTYTSVVMADDGAGGDAVAGDGLYSATIAGQVAGSLIAFNLQATDNSSTPETARFPNDAPLRECLIRFGDPQPTGRFGTYRIWTTQTTFNRWKNRQKLSNEPLDVTFVYGNFRVIYNAGSLYSGSPWHTGFYSSPTNGMADYGVVFPKDDQLLGGSESTLSWPGNGGDDPTAQREQASYWIAAELGLPFNYRRYVTFFINGVRRAAVMEDTQQPNAEAMEQWHHEDPAGELYKVAMWFEFDSAASSFTATPATLQNFVLAGGAKKLARYRWNWQKRAVKDSVNDYSSLFGLVDALNAPGLDDTYVRQIESVMDVEQWMRTFAVEHICGNWDSYGNSNGQNMYAYKPRSGKWQLHIWDFDISLGSGDAATSGLFQAGDALVTKLYNRPVFRRAYWRACQDAVNGPLLNLNVNPLLDARYAALTNSGLAVSSPGSIKSYIASRRTYLLSQLAGMAASFAITSNGGTDFSSANNSLTLTGTAPINVVAIKINGVEYRPTWTTVTGWSIDVPLKDGFNPLVVEGFDARGNPLSNATATVNVTFTGSDDLPPGHLLINEIMYHPAMPDAAFVEIHNTSSRTAYDLSGWRLDGADFIFPNGSVIQPSGFLVVANNREAFASAYGRSIPLAGEFRGRLSNSGETLRLIMPGATAADDLVLNEVTYSAFAPWPALADGSGPSLQLIDPTQDSSRVADWTAVDTNAMPLLAPYTPGAANSVSAILPRLPALWLNETQPYNPGGVHDRFGDHDPWIELYNGATNTINLGGYYLTDNYADLARWPFPASATIGPGKFLVIWADGEAAESAPDELHANFRLAPENGSIALAGNVGGQLAVIDYLNYGSIPAGRSFGRFPDGRAADLSTFYYVTPGASNDHSPGPLTLFINEWMASNTNAVVDPTDGHFDDWFELYNPNSTAIDLTGYTLTDNLTNTARWPIPFGTTIGPREHVLVWADKDTNQPPGSDLHAAFKLDKAGDEIGLYGPDGTLVDVVQFGDQPDDVSQGRWPDGGADIYFMLTSTPRAANVLAINPPPLEILRANASPDGYFALSWNSDPGKIYRVQYRDDLGGADWTDLPGDVFSYGNKASKADPQPIRANPRYYRVVLSP